jgi:hypothetical protein
MRRWWRWPRRRARVVIVDAAALQELRELAVLGQAWQIVVDEELRWLNMDDARGDDA